jgi:hypothetical protein
MEMKGLLHEKIQLYIYKPSINNAVDAIAGNLSHLQHFRLCLSLRDKPPPAASEGYTKINSPYYEEFTE